MFCPSTNELCDAVARWRTSAVLGSTLEVSFSARGENKPRLADRFLLFPPKKFPEYNIEYPSPVATCVKELADLHLIQLAEIDERCIFSSHRLVAVGGGPWMPEVCG